MLPYVFILDWDGTVVGKVDYQSQRFSMTKTMRKYGYRVPASTLVPKAFTKDEHLVRPGFAHFINGMREFYENCTFFIYTGSEKSWALQEIAWVEKAHGIKFERPIFTRNECIMDSTGNYKKSIKSIWPRVMRTLQQKYRIFTKEERDQILNNHTMIIDNNAVYMDHQNKLLLCPDYGYIVFENLFDGFPKDAFHHQGVQQLVLSLVNQGMMCPQSHRGTGAGGASNGGGESIESMMEMAKQYEWFATKCRSLGTLNRNYKTDVFWKYLRKLIIKNNIKQFNTTLTQQLQSAVWKRNKKLLLASTSGSRT